MRAMVCHEFGSVDNLVIADLPSPEPAQGQVKVEIHAIGVNYTDCLLVTGRSQLKRQPPISPGVEAAGIVREVGPGVTRFVPGQRVLGTKIHGTYAEEVVFSEDEICVIPDEMDMPTAATFYVGAMTGYYGICQRAKIATGEVLLVLGAGGGAGLAAVEIGKALGASVVAAASSERKLGLAASRGADVCIRYPQGPLDLDAQKTLLADFLSQCPVRDSKVPQIGEISTVQESAGYHVIFDGVGGTYAEPALRALAWKGRYLSVGFAAGVPKVSLGTVLFKDADIMGIQPADEEVRLPGRDPKKMAQLFDWYLQGLLQPQITEQVELEKAAEVLRLMSERQLNGRVALLTDRA